MLIALSNRSSCACIVAVVHACGLPGQSLIFFEGSKKSTLPGTISIKGHSASWCVVIFISFYGMCCSFSPCKRATFLSVVQECLPRWVLPLAVVGGFVKVQLLSEHILMLADIIFVIWWAFITKTLISMSILYSIAPIFSLCYKTCFPDLLHLTLLINKEELYHWLPDPWFSPILWLPLQNSLPWIHVRTSGFTQVDGIFLTWFIPPCKAAGIFLFASIWSSFSGLLPEHHYHDLKWSSSTASLIRQPQV